MPLPLVPLPSSSLELGGEHVTFHALTRAQALRLNAYRGREDEAEDYLLACALDITEDEARAWREAVDWDTAGALVDAVIDLSGLSRSAIAGATDAGPKA